MNREKGLELLRQNLQNQNLIKHCLAMEAIMRALAGLLPEIDYEKTKGDASQHSLIGAKMLEDLGIDKDICQAVKFIMKPIVFYLKP